jgi:hypothetical protein
MDRQSVYCEGHQELREIMIRVEERQIAMDKRINGTVDDIKSHINNSRPRNIAIIGVAVTIFIWVFNIAVEAGATRKQVEVNTKIIETKVNK